MITYTQHSAAHTGVEFTPPQPKGLRRRRIYKRVEQFARVLGKMCTELGVVSLSVRRVLCRHI